MYVAALYFETRFVGFEKTTKCMQCLLTFIFIIEIEIERVLQAFGLKWYLTFTFTSYKSPGIIILCAAQYLLRN